MKYILFGLIITTCSCTNSEPEMENNTYSYWIQRYDYSSHDFGIASVEEAIEAFNEFDWNLELSLRIEGSGDKDCPSGIGINTGYKKNKSKKFLLHICPENQNNIFFNLHYPVLKKYFGFIPYIKEEVYYANKIPKSKVPEIIRLFYKENFKEIIKITSSQ